MAAPSTRNLSKMLSSILVKKLIEYAIAKFYGGTKTMLLKNSIINYNSMFGQLNFNQYCFNKTLLIDSERLTLSFSDNKYTMDFIE